MTQDEIAKALEELAANIAELAAAARRAEARLKRNPADKQTAEELAAIRTGIEIARRRQQELADQGGMKN